MSGIQFAFAPATGGGRLNLFTRRKLGRRQLPVTDWQAASRNDVADATLRYLKRLLDSGLAIDEGTALLLSTEVLLDIPSSIASVLGMPEIAPLALELSLSSTVQSPDGEIRTAWTDPSFRRVAPRRDGMFVEIGSRLWRLSSSLFWLLEAIDQYNGTKGQRGEERIGAWLAVQERLGALAGGEVKAEKMLQNLRIYQAEAFALDARETAGGPEFDPIPMSASMRANFGDYADAPENGDDPAAVELKDNEKHALLVPELQRQFLAVYRADTLDTHPSYVLGRNTYVVIEPDLRRALDVVKRINRAPEAERRAFLKNPRSYIAQALPDAGDEAGSIFVETRQYSERVRGLGIWQRPQLPWLQRKGTGWLPEGFSLNIGNQRIELTEQRLRTLAAAHDDAVARNAPTFTVDGQVFSTTEVGEALERLGGFGESDQAEFKGDPKPEDDREVLLGDDNIEGLGFTAGDKSRPLATPKLMPVDLVRTEAKPHQVEGFSWLVDAWVAGLPGVLLADDMGLGKTFQALAFLAWFRANAGEGGDKTRDYRYPILIVAPTALLWNWQKEADIHLNSGALGECVQAFGSGLAQLKNRTATPEDALDVQRLRGADWVLTTYETLATYHRAFARVAFSVAIFDEIQKIKAPDTINTHAAKLMNADFVLGMTGTPIENRIEDIWCIMDRVVPGKLGDLKSFSSSYGGESADGLTELKARLDQPTKGQPRLMLRRLKGDHLRGLPARGIDTYRKILMPAEQAAAYAAIVTAARAGTRSKGDMLKIVHRLRGVSLHPNGAAGFDPYNATARDKWIAASARVMQTLDILAEIQRRGEKALVFIEDRAVQSAFAVVVAATLGLAAEPDIINGETPADLRQKIVDRFQAAPKGFGLLLLSPKAAGVGLTITAANHVIHLSRWWNPAVEDQCNDRVYRIGQTKPVTVHIPLAVHPEFGDASFDVKLDQLLERKRSLSRDMLMPPVSNNDAETLFGEAVGQASV
jgi:superfamily II DNA or RNA helicase